MRSMTGRAGEGNSPNPYTSSPGHPFVLGHSGSLPLFVVSHDRSHHVTKIISSHHKNIGVTLTVTM